MAYAKYNKRDDYLIPSEVILGDKITPVWLQQRWQEGEFTQFVIKNGCGHCCTSMVLNLKGIKINPHEEFVLCRKLWGEPKEEKSEDNFLSVAGIVKVLAHFGVSASYFGAIERKKAREHIVDSLKDGKLVIFTSMPSQEYPENMFSTGAHYVLAVGFTEDGKILIANSSEKTTDLGVHLVDEKVIETSIYAPTNPEDFTWGVGAKLPVVAGYVVVD